jgi:hypothetical protein
MFDNLQAIDQDVQGATWEVVFDRVVDVRQSTEQFGDLSAEHILLSVV